MTDSTKSSELTQRKIHVLTIADRHIRLVSPLLKRADVIWYSNPGLRHRQIDSAVKHLKITKRPRSISGPDFLKKVMTTGDIFFAPMRLSHGIFAKASNLREFRSKDLTKLESKFVLMDEVLLFYRPDLSDANQYTPFCDLAITKSKAEHSYYKKKDPALNLQFVGQTELDRIKRLKSVGSDIGVFLASVPNNIMPAIDAIKRDLTLMIKNHNFKGRVYIKDHINALNKNQFVNIIVQHCKRLKVRTVLVDKRNGLMDTATKISHALVQGTINTHFVLKRLGIDSYFYDNNLSPIKMSFLKKSKMPSITYSDQLSGKYKEEIYDKWMREQFILDGKCGDRLIDAILNK